jgi:phosphatidyl-myo-inositol alpha-mannosyltransferase
MRIGIVTEYYYPTLGGIQEHVHHFARQARRVGHDVRILTPEVRDRLASVGGAAPSATAARRLDQDLDESRQVIRIGVSVPVLSGGSIARVSMGADLSARMREIMRAERFDVLHVHSPLMPTLPLLALRSSDALNVGTFHSAFDHSFVMGLLRRPLQRYLDRLHAAVGVSETALAGVGRYFRAPWSVIPNGVDVASFASGRRRPEFDDGRLNVLHVGRFDPRNGVDRVVRAWLEVRRRGTDARLIVVGDGPLRQRYEAMVPAALRADAHFVGFVPADERSSYYASGDLLLCPATGGTFGIIALEAMAAGCPVVAADTPGFRNVVRNGVDGLLVDVSAAADPGSRSLADAANRLLLDESARRRLVEAGRRTAAAFDWREITARVLELYARLRGELPQPSARARSA